MQVTPLIISLISIVVSLFSALTSYSYDKQITYNRLLVDRNLACIVVRLYASKTTNIQNRDDFLRIPIHDFVAVDGALNKIDLGSLAYAEALEPLVDIVNQSSLVGRWRDDPSAVADIDAVKRILRADLAEINRVVIENKPLFLSIPDAPPHDCA